MNKVSASELEKAVYKICLEAAKSLNKNLKYMSWFGKNHK